MTCLPLALAVVCMPTKTKEVGYRSFHNPLRGDKRVDWGLEYLCETIIDSGEMDMDPPYQRGHVWTQDQQIDYLGFLLEGGASPPVFVRELSIDAACNPPFYEVVDGKQRITALYMWWNDRIPGRLGPNHNFREIWRNQFSRIELRQVKRDLSVDARILYTNFEETLLVYLRLNRGGTPHTDEDIDRVHRIYQRVKLGQYPSE